MRKKHGGAEESLSDIALPMYVHSLLKASYDDFCIKQRGAHSRGTVAHVEHREVEQHLGGEVVPPLAHGNPEGLPIRFEFD